MRYLNKIVFGVLFLTVTSLQLVNAQVKDTLSVKYRLQNPYYKGLATQVLEQPELLFSRPIETFVEMDLGYSSSEKKVRNAKTARKTKDLYFDAKGILPLKKMWLSGEVSLKRNELSDVGYNLSDLLHYRDEVSRSPFFNLAYREGDWENQLYKLQGQLAYHFTSKFILNIGADYKVSQYFRVTNPVPKLTYLDLLGDLKLTYAISEKSSLGLAGYAGFLHNDINITFNGDTAQLNLPNNEELFTRISTGLGLIESAQDISNARERESVFGTGIFYTYSDANYLFTAKVNYKFSENIYYQLVPIGDVNIGKYSVDHVDAEFNFTDFDKSYAVKLASHYKTGSNFRTLFNGKNYEATSFNTSASFVKTWDAFSITAKGRYEDLKKIDFQAVNAFQYKNASIGGALFYNFNLKKGMFYTEFEPLYSFNIDKSQSYETVNPFTENVLIPFVDIATAKRLEIEFKIGYQTKWKQKTLLDFGVQTSNNRFWDTEYQGINTSLTAFLKIIY